MGFTLASFQESESFTRTYRRTLVNTVADDNDYLISASGGNTITLPPAASCLGRTIGVKRFPGTVGNVTINVSGGGQLENTANNFVVSVTLNTLTLFWVSNGTQWECVAK